VSEWGRDEGREATYTNASLLLTVGGPAFRIVPPRSSSSPIRRRHASSRMTASSVRGPIATIFNMSRASESRSVRQPRPRTRAVHPAAVCSHHLAVTGAPAVAIYAVLFAAHERGVPPPFVQASSIELPFSCAPPRTLAGPAVRNKQALLNGLAAAVTASLTAPPAPARSAHARWATPSPLLPHRRAPARAQRLCCPPRPAHHDEPHR
jgi:hypothetical protein